MTQVQPIKIAILAMGGEGGGVLADWIVELGESNGYIAQTTSVPGVAQRTGATIYYVEMYPRVQAEADGAQPVLALMPMPGDVDLVLASELMEAGRAVQRGLVTPDRTTLIASTHRVYAIAEKIAMGDGRADATNLRAHAEAAAKRFVRFDMAKLAEDTGSMISAVLFGALSGTGVLPFSRAQFEAVIEAGGVGVKASLRAFEAGFAQATQTTQLPSLPGEGSGGGTVEGAVVGAVDAATPRDPQVRALLARINSEFPESARHVLTEGVRRLIDYQDPSYAAQYLDRLARLHGENKHLLIETARHLALWMSYEDTIRVAELKTRDSRFDRVRSEVRAQQDQLLAVSEFMHPRLQEICDTLPAGLGRWLARSGWPRRLVEHFTQKGRVVTTSSLRGFLLLYTLASMKRWRRGSLRFQAENRHIEDWLARVEQVAKLNPQLAIEVAQCQRLVKGYGDTYENGLRNFELLMEAIARGGAGVAPATVRELRDAALADERGDKLREALVRHGMNAAGAAATQHRPAAVGEAA